MKTSLPLYDAGEARELAKSLCREAGISIRTLEDLVEAELEQQGKKSRHGLYQEFDNVLSEEEE